MSTEVVHLAQPLTDVGRGLDERMREIRFEFNDRTEPPSPRYYTPDGEPCTMGRWAEDFERRFQDPDTGWWKLGDTELARGTRRVSTVWLGMNHAWGTGPPLIFESMIFGGRFAGEMLRYTTPEQAAVGHEILVALVRRDPSIPLPVKPSLRVYSSAAPRRRWGEHEAKPNYSSYSRRRARRTRARQLRKARRLARDHR